LQGPAEVTRPPRFSVYLIRSLLAERSTATRRSRLASPARSLRLLRRRRVCWLVLGFALSAPRRQFSLGLQPVVGFVPRHRSPLKEKLVRPLRDLVLAGTRSGASSIGLRH